MDFSSDGVRLHFELHGPDDGTPIIVVHGFASDYRLNWVGSRWQETLTGSGFRVIGLDCRGHGQSDKPHDEAAYTLEVMTADVVRLLDHVDVAEAAHLGYSMGARIGLEVVLDNPERITRAVLGGIGGSGAIEHAVSTPCEPHHAPPCGQVPVHRLDADDVARGAPELIEEIPTAHLYTIPNRDHMSAVTAREFKSAAVEFLTSE